VTIAAQGIFDEVTSGISIGEEDLRSYYVRNLDRYRLPARRLIRHRLEETLEKARQAAARLASGAGDSPQWEIRRGDLSGALEDEIFQAQVGELIGPIESELGWHVALLEGIFDSGYQSFEGVRHEIESDLLSVARGRAFDQWLEQERRHLATVAPGWGHPGDPTLPDFSHRH
jgi:parvulin-like peptidyl-prolyl isomerase